MKSCVNMLTLRKDKWHRSPSYWICTSLISHYLCFWFQLSAGWHISRWKQASPQNSYHLAVNSEPKHLLFFSNFPHWCCCGLRKTQSATEANWRLLLTCITVNSVCVCVCEWWVCYDCTVPIIFSCFIFFRFGFVFVQFGYNWSVNLCFMCVVTNFFGCITVFIIYCHLNRPSLCHTGAAGKRLNLENKSICLSAFSLIWIWNFQLHHTLFACKDASAATPQTVLWTAHFTSRTVKNKDEKKKKDTFLPATSQMWQLQTCCPTCPRGSN